MLRGMVLLDALRGGADCVLKQHVPVDLDSDGAPQAYVQNLGW
jgi:hypothetical protein